MVADIIVLFAWVALFLLRDSWWKMSTCDRLSPLALSRATGNDSLRILASYCLRWPRQRTELCHRTAAIVDPLTRIANRRSFPQERCRLLNITLESAADRGPD